MPTYVRSTAPFVSPLTVSNLPLSLRMMAGAETIRKRGIRRLAQKAARAWFKGFHRGLGVPLRGELLLATPGGERRLGFDGSNTHFGCLYMPHLAGGYEASCLALLDLLVGRTGCFFDIGSNFGYYALSLAARPGFAGTIHAFEPFGPSFKDLSDLVAAAALGELVACHALALSDRDGTAYLECDAMHSALARLGEDESGPEVEVARLDTLGLPRAEVIKIDVEGHEAAVLEGAERTIADDRPAILFESLRLEPPSRTMEPFCFLGGRGYVFFLPAWRVGDGKDGYFVDSPPVGAKGEAPLNLALVAFSPQERLLLKGDPNILAWPEERLAELAELFGGD